MELNTDLQRLFGARPPVTIFDVGANVGQTTCRLAQSFPQAIIHAFEPVKETFAALQRNVRALPRVVPHNLALGASDTHVRMKAVPVSGSNRIIADDDTAVGGPIETVELCRLDTFCRSADIASIDLLKTDCEGHDLAVLQGAGSLLDAGRIACVYCEVNLRRDGMHADFFAMESLLRPRHYTFYALYDYSGWQYDVSSDGFANALFVSNTLLQSAASR